MNLVLVSASILLVIVTFGIQESFADQASGKPAWEVGSDKVCSDQLCSEIEEYENSVIQESFAESPSDQISPDLLEVIQVLQDLGRGDEPIYIRIQMMEQDTLEDLRNFINKNGGHVSRVYEQFSQIHASIPISLIDPITQREDVRWIVSLGRVASVLPRDIELIKYNVGYGEPNFYQCGQLTGLPRYSMQFDYSIEGGSIVSICGDHQKFAIILIDANKNGILNIEIPRNILDSFSSSCEDLPFAVQLNNKEIQFDEQASELSRKLTIPFSSDSKRIDITSRTNLDELKHLVQLCGFDYDFGWKYISPKKQLMIGNHPRYIKCNDGLSLVFKSSNNSPVCVKPKTAVKLIERGWISTSEIKEKPLSVTKFTPVQILEIATNFVMSSKTFQSALEDTLKVDLVHIRESYPEQYVVEATFDMTSTDLGYNPGVVIEQAITPRTMELVIINGEITSAIIDQIWDELHQMWIENN